MDSLNINFFNDIKIKQWKKLKNQKVLIVNTQWNKKIVQNLTQASQNLLIKVQIKFDIITVPGAFELGLAIKLSKQNYDAFIALGAVIKGETFHFEAVSYAVSSQLSNLTLELEKPIGFGVLMAKNLKQADYRSQNNPYNKGYEATAAILDMLLLKHEN